MWMALQSVCFSILVSCFTTRYTLNVFNCFSVERSFPTTWLLLVCRYGTAVDQDLLKSRPLPWVAKSHSILQEWFQKIRVRHPSSAAELHGHKMVRRIANNPWHMKTLSMFAQLPSSSSVPSLSSREVHSFNAVNQFCFWKECIHSEKNQDILTYYYYDLVTFDQCYGYMHSQRHYRFYQSFASS